MGLLRDKGCFQEIACGDNFGYILSDDIGIANTEYMMLQSQGKDFFIPCMKMLYNGKKELYYVASGYRCLNSLCGGMTSDSFLMVAANLLADIIGTADIGFLSCQNIDLTWERIYVDETTLKVKLVYLPVNRKNYDSYPAFENELRSGMIKKINELFAVPNEKMDGFLTDLCSGSMTLKDIYQGLNRFGNKAEEGSGIPGAYTVPGEMHLIAQNAPMPLNITIDRDELLIGKKAELADVALPFNSLISRRHCKVTRNGCDFYVTDVGSANGTYVNGKRLAVDVPCRLQGGDVLRLANSEFRVEM